MNTHTTENNQEQIRAIESCGDVGERLEGLQGDGLFAGQFLPVQGVI